MFGLARDDLRAWRYVVADDTLSFVLRGAPATRLLSEVRRAGRTLGFSEATLDPSTGLARQATIDLPFERSRFEFTIEDVDTLATIDPAIWRQN